MLAADSRSAVLRALGLMVSYPRWRWIASRPSEAAGYNVAASITWLGAPRASGAATPGSPAGGAAGHQPSAGAPPRPDAT